MKHNIKKEIINKGKMINTKLDLGCGSKKFPGYIGVDIGRFDYPEGEFVQADINYPLPFSNESFIEIKALQTIEHINNNRKIEFMAEIHRLLKSGGIFIAEFPPPIDKNGNPNAIFFTDPTHTAWWTADTFACFCKSFREQDENKAIYEIGYSIDTQFEYLKKDWISDGEMHIELVKL